MQKQTIRYSKRSDIFMRSFPEGFFKDSVKRKDCFPKIYFCKIYV